MRQSVLASIVFIAIVSFWSLVPSGCANIVPPTGGPRDSIPPVLVKADPPDSSVNFRSKHITLTFDEYIDLRDVQNNLLFTPTFEKSPGVRVKGRTVTIPFEKDLEPNTTYVLNFGNAITDINEGNPLKNFTYTFSTGPVLDSLEISGRVVLAETGAIDTTLLAVLHRDLNDSAVRKLRPPYVVRLDRNGAFRFHNLPKDTFAVYILEAGLDRRYGDTTKLFAFAGRPVIAGETDSLVLYAYRGAEKAAPIASGQNQNQRIPATDRRLRFTPAVQGQQELDTNYVLNFQTPLRRFDSTRVQLSADSAFAPVNYTVSLDSTKKVMSLKSQWQEGMKYNLILDKEFAVDTNGRQLLKTDTLYFTTKKLSDYGDITIRFRNLDLSKKPLLQFVQNGAVQFSVPLTAAIYKGTFIKPGDYNLRIVYDTNGNGKWDPGQFSVRRQPELAKPIERTVSVKPSFENEVEVVID